VRRRACGSPHSMRWPDLVANGAPEVMVLLWIHQTVDRQLVRSRDMHDEAGRKEKEKENTGEGGGSYPLEGIFNGHAPHRLIRQGLCRIRKIECLPPTC
jgi:hypothetical protein